MLPCPVVFPLLFWLGLVFPGLVGLLRPDPNVFGRGDSRSLKKRGGAGIGDGLGLRLGLRLLRLLGVGTLLGGELLGLGIGVLMRGVEARWLGDVLRPVLPLLLLAALLDDGHVDGKEGSRPTCPPAPRSGAP